MHLRGPMNISQLAVYQVPSEALKMRKRNTVPFYNRRQAPKQRDLHFDGTGYTQPSDKRTWTTTTNCSFVSTVTSTVTVTDCGAGLSSTSTALPNTTYVGPPLPCEPTPEVLPTTIDTWYASVINTSSSVYTSESPPTVTQNLERHPDIIQPLSSTTETAKLRKRAAAWDRVAYYTSTAPAQATGISFLANLGDPRQSGTFD